VYESLSSVPRSRQPIWIIRFFARGIRGGVLRYDTSRYEETRGSHESSDLVTSPAGLF